jgi:hypothetical protein
MRLRGRYNGQQIVPAAVVDDIRKGGDRAKFVPAGGDRALRLTSACRQRELRCNVAPGIRRRRQAFDDEQALDIVRRRVA